MITRDFISACLIGVFRGFLFLCIPLSIAAYLLLFIWLCVYQPWKIGTVIMGIALIVGASVALGVITEMDKTK